jgi:hypothetical protein
MSRRHNLNLTAEQAIKKICLNETKFYFKKLPNNYCSPMIHDFVFNFLVYVHTVRLITRLTYPILNRVVVLEHC